MDVFTTVVKRVVRVMGTVVVVDDVVDCSRTDPDDEMENDGDKESVKEELVLSRTLEDTLPGGVVGSEGDGGGTHDTAVGREGDVDGKVEIDIVALAVVGVEGGMKGGIEAVTVMEIVVGRDIQMVVVTRKEVTRTAVEVATLSLADRTREDDEER